MLLKEIERLREERDGLVDEIASTRRSGLSALRGPRREAAPVAGEKTAEEHATEARTMAADALRGVFGELLEDIRKQAGAAADAARDASAAAEQVRTAQEGARAAQERARIAEEETRRSSEIQRAADAERAGSKRLAARTMQDGRRPSKWSGSPKPRARRRPPPARRRRRRAPPRPRGPRRRVRRSRRRRSSAPLSRPRRRLPRGRIWSSWSVRSLRRWRNRSKSLLRGKSRRRRQATLS